MIPVRTFRRLFTGAAVLGMLIPALATAQSGVMNIPGLFATGVDANGQQLLSVGALDPHYRIISQQSYYYPSGPSGAVATYTPGLVPAVVDRSGVGDGGPCVGHNSWYVPTRGCWIWFDPAAATADVTFTFRLWFDLTGLDHNTATIQGLAAADDFLSVFLNGASVATTAPLPGLHRFTANSGFTSGLNFLDFAVSGTGGVDGLLVDELSGTAVALVPEPSPRALLLLGGAGLFLMAIRRRRQS